MLPRYVRRTMSQVANGVQKRRASRRDVGKKSE